jgi:SAM-dependent methyltransferase
MGTSVVAMRRSVVFETADPKGSVLEIGPAYSPILAKRDGFHTKTVDYLDRLGLAEKYKPHGKTLEQFEEVDFVLSPGATMADSIKERFDLVLASHVIEHTTSLIHLVNECASLLTEDGALGLFVPDHRFCFDRFRDRSSLGAVIDASLGEIAVHTMGTITEFSLNVVTLDGTGAWSPSHSGAYALMHDYDQVRRRVKESDGAGYVDAHHWVFTPNHMRLLLHDLAEMGHISLREAFFHDTVGCEFFISLKADGAGPGMSRHQLLELADAERRALDVPVFESPRES